MAITDFRYDPEVYDTSSAERIVPLLIEKFNPGSVLDIGCGNGTWLKTFMDLGVADVIGIDGAWALESDLRIPRANFLAFNIERSLDLNRKFDLALCLETAEHIEERFAEQLIDSLTRHSDTIIFSAAIPGQPGDGHINLKEPDYWGGLLREKGFYTYDLIRPMIWNDEQIHWWYRQNIFVASKTMINGTNPGNIPLISHPGYIQFMEEMKKFPADPDKPAKQTFLKRLLGIIKKN